LNEVKQIRIVKIHETLNLEVSPGAIMTTYPRYSPITIPTDIENFDIWWYISILHITSTPVISIFSNQLSTMPITFFLNTSSNQFKSMSSPRHSPSPPRIQSSTFSPIRPVVARSGFVLPGSWPRAQRWPWRRSRKGRTAAGRGKPYVPWWRFWRDLKH
jgi:hypothetical protein